MEPMRLRYPLLYLCIMVSFWCGAFVIFELWPESLVGPILIVSFLVIGGGFGAASVITWFQYISRISYAEAWKKKQLEIETPALELAKVIAQMRPDQVLLFPQARYAAEIGVVPGMNGPEYYLLTPFMNIPLIWLDEYINVMCSRVELFPVRRFASESVEQKYAQAFTAWVTQPQLHLAIPANGPDPAKWVSPMARQRCVELIWGEADNGLETD